MIKQYRVKIDKVIRETNESAAYLFVPIDDSDGLFDYTVGQFYTLQADIDRQNKEGKNVQERDKRAYSIVSTPMNKEYIELLLQIDFPKDKWEGKALEERRTLQAPFAQYFIEQYKEGDECVLIGPNGRFLKSVFDNNEDHIAYWYASSGIPSGLSLCEYVLENGLKKKIILFGSNKTLEDVIYHDRIRKAVDSSDGMMQFICTLTRQELTGVPPSSPNKIIYRTKRFFSDHENTLQKYTGLEWPKFHHAICGSSSFINGAKKSRKDNSVIRGMCTNESCKKEFKSVTDKSGTVIQICDICGAEVEIFKGIKNRLIDIGVKENRIEMDQYYLH
jgi:ferredoxin-NADP reductase